jgi:hypothetical protein
MSRGAAPGGKVKGRLIGQSEAQRPAPHARTCSGFCSKGKFAHFVLAFHIISFCVTSTRLLNSGEPAQSGRLISVDLNIAKMISTDEISRYHAVNAQDVISYWYEIAWVGVGCSASNPTEMKKKMAVFLKPASERHPDCSPLSSNGSINSWATSNVLESFTL